MIPAWVDGTLTPVEKLEAHQRGLRHKAVSVFVMRGEQGADPAARDGQVPHARAVGEHLLHPSRLGRRRPSTAPCAVWTRSWGSPGFTPRYRDQVEYRADVGGGLIEHEVVDIFVADAPADLTVEPEPRRGDGQCAGSTSTTWRQRSRRWPDRFTPWLRIYLDEHKDRIFGTLARA